ncbi:beta-ketoacyl synthase [Antarcticibacterium arcticum]|uniref:Beta-ketoacyl synthase n=1 Tax=Antarcticibacterium arcticum TaxID=2585771 RepID=A0A5B8YPP3_9FLAO|nr:beta-ketoacyl synthase N-terminal-like domain-containing protein [Antarcticibacterium arcticum]QED38286.1 beta-ketoacyl synthase [Antarcticibacterium arcticum]
MRSPVFIKSIATISSLGNNPGEIWNNYKSSGHFISSHDFGGENSPAAFLSMALKKEIEQLKLLNTKFKKLDDSVLFALYVSGIATAKAGWNRGKSIGINIGSSRGATSLFEKHHSSFLKNGTADISTSPTTTLGNISSWVSYDLKSNGADISHSVTCSTGLHAILNACAWLGAGMEDHFLAGGSEAALTPFTIAQMKALRIYGREGQDYPCRSLDMQKKENSMVLGEGAGVVCLEKNPENSIGRIAGIGYATEKVKHSVSISASATCLNKSMRMAIGNMPLADIDAIVMHAPGTVKGDLAELKAVQDIFGENMPALTSNKWKVGHTFGTSGILSLELAVLMLEHQEFIEVPFSNISRPPEKLRNILINAVGFGGNAVSILVNNS